MSLSLAALIASNSLNSISAQTNLVSRNISGANTPGYSLKIARLSTQFGGSSVMAGVERASNLALFKSMLSANAGYGNWKTIDNTLAGIEASFDTSGASTSPAAGLSRLRDALQSFSTTPADPNAANGVLRRANDLVSYLHDASQTVQSARTDADAEISQSVTRVRDLLEKFESVNKNIVSGTSLGDDVTDDLDQRDRLLSELSAELGIKTVIRQNNDMVIYTDSGVTLFETTPREISFEPTQTYVATTKGNAVLVDGVPIAGDGDPRLNIESGKLVGLVKIRDDIAPDLQSQLDETARGLIVAFAESDQLGTGKPDLPGLFTYPTANGIPGPTIIPGLAAQLFVNPNVDPTRGGDLNRLRDGGISVPGDDSYLYNKANEPGYSGRVLQMIDKMNKDQDFDATTGLRPKASLLSYAGDSVGWLASQRQEASTKASYQSALVSQTSQSLSNETGVNIDEQMSRMLALENSYQASAKLLAAVNDMYSVLFAAIRS